MNIAAILLSLVTSVVAEQLPYPLQLFYLNPNNVGTWGQPQITQYIDDAASSWRSPYGGDAPRDAQGTRYGSAPGGSQDNDEEVEEGEASQFHSQDGAGRSVFGYTTPDQARIEARDIDGTVRGSYSYLDAWGRVIKVQYWDDGSGFHAVGNNFPGAADLPQPVQDTPEVMAARENHLRLYQQILEQHAAIAAASGNTDPDASRRQDAEPAETPDYDVSYHGNQGMTRYPTLVHTPNLYDPTHKHDADREAVIVDSTDNNLRSAKNFRDEAVDQAEDADEDPKNKGFFYSFQYPVPLYVQVRTVEDGAEAEGQGPNGRPAISVSQKAALYGAVPVAAVHDVQVSPRQRESLKNHQVLPLYVEQPNVRDN